MPAPLVECDKVCQSRTTMLLSYCLERARYAHLVLGTGHALQASHIGRIEEAVKATSDGIQLGRVQLLLLRQLLALLLLLLLLLQARQLHLQLQGLDGVHPLALPTSTSISSMAWHQMAEISWPQILHAHKFFL